MRIINAIKVKKQWEKIERLDSRATTVVLMLQQKKRGYTNKLNIISIKNCLVNSFNSLNHRIKKLLKHSIYLTAMQSFPIQKKVNFKTEQKELYTLS